MTKEERLKQIIEEEEQARKNCYQSYCEELRYEWGDNAVPMSFEEWEKDFEEHGGWETLI